ncbi:MAG: hypothetical protein RMJ87_09870 [Cytophagales bacterium]|nr:hypothetical protein [Bernardetiaceae bacterium]MDW8205325.1 hypothetical protein [Cytophagales bacterium]
MQRIYKACLNDTGLFIAFVATTFCYGYASHGQLGMTLDSYYYLAAAQNWAARCMLVDHLGNTYTNWPPLYPWLLSLGAPDIMSFAVWLHGIALVASVFFFSRCLPNGQPSWLRTTVLLSYGLYAPLLACSIYLWSEVVFMALLLAAFVAFSKSDKQPCGRVLYIVVANLMCLQRHAGIFFVAAWALARLLEPSPWQSRIRAAFAEGVAASAAFWIWQWRNFCWIEHAQDFRQNAGLVSLSESIELSVSAMSTWLLPLPLPVALRIAVVGVAGAIILFFVLKERQKEHITNALLLSFGCYLAGMWVLRMNIPSENDRYFLPLFPFFLILLLQVLGTRPKIIILLLVWICLYQTARGLKNTYQWHQNNATRYESISNERIIGLHIHVGESL